MATQGLSKHLPKRASKDHRSHITRQRSRNARELQREVNKKDMAKRVAQNITRGFTGKQLDDAYRKYARMHNISYRELKRTGEVNNFTVAVETGLI